MTTGTTTLQLRCKNRLQGIIKEYPNGKKEIEIRCKDRFCAERKPGVVVIHVYDADSGELVRTNKYKDPKRVGQQALQPFETSSDGR